MTLYLQDVPPLHQLMLSFYHLAIFAKILFPAFLLHWVVLYFTGVHAAVYMQLLVSGNAAKKT